jgi:hypothetical protein
MKTALWVSLALNIGLTASLAFAFCRGRHSAARGADVALVVASADVHLPLPTGGKSITNVEAPRPATDTIRWSQLYAKDYHVYVKNLRAMGCPEATVRAIVTADFQAAFSVQVKKIESELMELRSGSWQSQIAGTTAEANLRAELAQVPDEEAAEINDMLGLKSPVQVAVLSQVPRPEEPPLTQPLVFQNVDLSGLNLSDEQQQAVARIRQDFLQSVGAAEQDLNDPAYRARWQQAESESDGMLQSVLGQDTYTEYQTLVAQRDLAQQFAPARKSAP